MNIKTVLDKRERLNRVIARGELSDHAHVIVGDATVTRKKDDVFVEVGQDGATMRHILESAWLKTGAEVPIVEKEKREDGHEDVALEPGTYKYIAQTEYDPFEKVIRRVQD